jgi:catechol 2,3-dioxygenase-like lactoylglutathione lyase family enzyme
VFDHVTIRASDREASERFYTLVLGTIGIEPTHSDDHFAQWADFIERRSTPAAEATDRPASVRRTTPVTTARSFWTPTETMSNW